MKQKVFGAGWAKTGTTTLGECLSTLGYRHQSIELTSVHLLETPKGRERLVQRAADFDSCEDWPWLLLYRELDGAYPDAKFVLTVRASDKWLHSYRRMIQDEGEATLEMNQIRSLLYGLDFPDVTDEELVGRYEQHNRDVQDYFRERPGKLAVLNWGQGDGWEVLCEHLEVPVPDAPFPHANSARSRHTLSARMQRRWLGVKRFVKRNRPS